MKQLLHFLTTILLLTLCSITATGQKTLLPKKYTYPNESPHWFHEDLSEISKPEIVVPIDSFFTLIRRNLNTAELEPIFGTSGIGAGTVLGRDFRYLGKYLGTNPSSRISEILSGFCFFPILEKVNVDTVRTIGWRAVIAYQNVLNDLEENQVFLMGFDNIESVIDDSFVLDITGNNEMNLLFSSASRTDTFTSEQQSSLQRSIEFDFVFLPFNDFVDLVQVDSDIVLERSRITYDTMAAEEIADKTGVPIQKMPGNLDNEKSWHFRSLAFRPDSLPSLSSGDRESFETGAYAYVDGKRCPPFWWDDDFFNADESVPDSRNYARLVESTLEGYATSSNTDAAIFALNYNIQMGKSLFSLSKFNLTYGVSMPTQGLFNFDDLGSLFELGVDGKIKSTEVYLTFGRYKPLNSDMIVVNSINFSPVRPVLFNKKRFSMHIIADIAFNWPSNGSISLGYRVGAQAEIGLGQKRESILVPYRYNILLGAQFHDFEFNDNALPNIIGLKAGISYDLNAPNSRN